MCLFNRQDDRKTIDILCIEDCIDELNKVYLKTSEYLDANFDREINSYNNEVFHQRWVEMITVYKLLNSKISLHKPNKEGGQPDIRIPISNNKEIWIECVSATPGDYKDILKIQCDDEDAQDAQVVPKEYLLPRVTSVIDAKIEQHSEHIKKATDKSSIIPILLVNVALLNRGIIPEYAGILQGWNDRFCIIAKDVSNDSAQIYTSPAEQIVKPKVGIPIKIDYFNDADFPFQVVVFSSEKLRSWSNTDENLILCNQGVRHSDVACNDINKVLDAIRIDYC